LFRLGTPFDFEFTRLLRLIAIEIGLAINPRNHSVIVIVVVFIGLQIVFVDSFLGLAHVSIGFKSVFCLHLLVQLVFVIFHFGQN